MATRPGADGLTNFQVSNTGISAYYFGGIVSSLANARILSIDKLVAGEVSTVTLDTTGFTVASFKISDGQGLKTITATPVSPGVYSFTPPAWVDGEIALKYGHVRVFANDGVEDTPGFLAILSLPAGYSSEVLDSVTAFSLPGSKIGTQNVFNVAQAYVYKDGVAENANGYSGVTQIWDRDPDDRIARVTPINVAPAVVTSITLTKQADGLYPRFTSKYRHGNRPVLSGGTPALEWKTNGTLSHGDLITVRTNVAGLFGAPDTRSQSLAMIGDETWVNGVNNPWLAAYANNELIRGYFDAGGGTANGYTGVPNDPSSPYHTVVGAAKTNITRHANISSAFKMSAFNDISNAGTEPGLFSWPKPFVESDRVPDAGRLCVATWTFYDYDNASEVNALQYQSISGTFQVGANTKPTRSGNNLVGGIVGLGERCSMVSGQGKTAMGYVKLVDSGWGYVEIDNSYTDEWFVADWSNAIVTGTVSGAVMTMGALVEGTNYYSEGASKSARILQHTVVSQVDTATVIAGVACGIGINVFYDATNAFTNAAPITVSTRAWHRRTIWVDYRVDGNGKIMCGQIIDNNAPQICLIDAHNVRSDIGPVLSNWGIEANVPNSHTAISGELKTYTDNMMCIVSSSPTWAGVDYLESEPLVRVGHRTSTEAQFKLSRGVYSSISGKYLYVLKDPMTPINTSGLLLTGA
ncbi:MAG: hypothetical protein E6R03_16360 [Hyphomicrobiaceae bacterium]|nr:MAG: hypothetical protein E6R03_16360 [Hyphomicrobiaceae bacterium]